MNSDEELIARMRKAADKAIEEEKAKPKDKRVKPMPKGKADFPLGFIED